MRLLTPGVAALVGAALFGAAAADDATGEQIARKYGCFTCHDATVWKAAPPFKLVAVKFRGRPDDAEARIFSALREGIGHPKSNASDDDIGSLLKWILAQ